MSIVRYQFFISAKHTTFAFKLFFCISELFVPLQKYLMLYIKQSFICKMLNITPPPLLIYNKEKSFCVGGDKFYRGCSLKQLKY